MQEGACVQKVPPEGGALRWRRHPKMVWVGGERKGLAAVPGAEMAQPKQQRYEITVMM